MPPGGYHGSYLRVDLATRTWSRESLPDDVLRAFLGGSGLGTWLLLRETPGALSALHPSMPVVFAFSPLVGSPLTTSAKFAVLAKSPLTNRINDSLSSSHFAIQGKKTGCDAIVIVGRAETPTALVIEPDEVRFEAADDVWGLPSLAAQERLRERLGSRFRLAAIGPAGERLVRFATLSHDSRHAGRGGIGAVLGSKRLKAVAVSGDRSVEAACPEELQRYSRELSKRSFGPATAKYRELGTVSNLLTFNRLGTLPTRNFQAGEFEGAAALSPEALSLQFEKTQASCAACTIGCEHIFGRRDGRGQVRLEYENLFALGPLCGIADPDVVLEASRVCDELGIDTISAGGTIAFAMECAERGLLDAPDLRFGNGPAFLECLRRIGNREGWLGRLLSEGSRIAAREIGQGSESFAPQVKGLEIPGYDPRALQTMALGFAVGARGADHNRSGAYQADFSERVNRLNPGDAAAALAIETEDEAAIMDSLILCKFLRGVFDDRLGEMAGMLRMITGWDVDAGALRATARRIVTAKKAYNIGQGWTPEEDGLPARFFDQPLAGGASAGAALDPDRLRSQIRAYNLTRGWSAEGWLPENVQQEVAAWRTMNSTSS
ncbi:MAG: aldehyde ferredoxin oxidoreductase family protein [Planctomyces sp.]|nr:aldehyde ferredoxin oxidoreductase family protein [Planctomyces sp.]